MEWVYSQTSAPPYQPQRLAMMASTGIITVMAASRGRTSMRSGGMFMVVRASISW